MPTLKTSLVALFALAALALALTLTLRAPERATPQPALQSEDTIDAMPAPAIQPPEVKPRNLDPDDFRKRAEGATRWTIPASNRIGGIDSTALAPNPEAWVNTLTPEDRPAARAFLDRYGDAYTFNSKAELAWLIEAGFPSLEEVVEYRRLADSLRGCASSTPPCQSSKVAVLIADEGFERLASARTISAENASEVVSARVQITGALRQARQQPSMLFALHVTAASAAIRDVPYEQEAALGLAYACGDLRRQQGDVAVATALRMLTDSPNRLCGAPFLPNLFQ